MTSRLLTAVTTAGLAAAGIATAAPAHADVPCTITSFSPRTVVVGLTPITATFGISTTGCTREWWHLSSDEFGVDKESPQSTFNPFTNSEAGPAHVIASASNIDGETRERVFANGFSLKRRSAWKNNTFNASPEPVRKGKSIAIKGQLLLADWDNNRYKVYDNRTVSIQFRTPTGSYATVKTAKTRRDGWVSTTVTAKRTGVWRVVYYGNSLAGAAVTNGDAVKVVS